MPYATCDLETGQVSVMVSSYKQILSEIITPKKGDVSMLNFWRTMSGFDRRFENLD